VIAAAVVVAGLGVMALTGASGPGGGGTRTVHMVFDNAFGLVEGGDFRIGGVRAGQTTKFSIKSSRTGPPKAIVTARLNQPGFGRTLRRDARCTIRPQSLVGEYFVDCQPGSGKPLPDGGTVPLANNAGTVPQDLVNDILRRPARERLRLFVASLGTGLAGRPADLQAVLRRAWPGLRETRRTLGILGRQNQTLKQFITDADTIVTRVEARKHDVTRFIRDSRGAAETGASRRVELRDATRRLPGLLRELRPSMAELSGMAKEGGPLADDLRASAPAATGLLQRTGPFARSALPALKGLGEAARPATQALRESGSELANLRRIGRDAPATAKPLRQLLQSLDSRRHAVDSDPRGRATQPPAPDPTHVDSGGGFTGFESIANYFFWQTMTTNGFDAIGHQLRVGATVSKCSPYRNAPPTDGDSEQLFKDCNSWLGPRQPGINAPDPSVPGSAASKVRAAKGSAPSEPKVELPPTLKKLIERSGGNTDPVDPTAPGQAQPPATTAPAPAGGAPQPQPNPTGLLDFLLKP
jgi:ABC-type transporter Mla subunit MlaD